MKYKEKNTRNKKEMKERKRLWIRGTQFQVFDLEPELMTEDLLRKSDQEATRLMEQFLLCS